jgi:hypothetical protein
MFTAQWLNDKQPDENGDIVAVILNENGGRVSTFKGASIEEVADKLLDNQLRANVVISRLRQPDQAKLPQKNQPKQLTPSDKLRLVDQMADPEKVVDAVTEIFTATAGTTPDRIGRKLSKDEEADYYATEAKAFITAHPDYISTDRNRDALFDELKANGWDLTRNNLAIAYETLKEREDLELRPQSNEEEPPQSTGGGSSPAQPAAAATPPPPTPRPRSVATGIRNSDATALAPPPPKRQKYTRADIEVMSRAEFQRKLAEEPGFRQQVDAMGS